MLFESDTRSSYFQPAPSLRLRKVNLHVKTNPIASQTLEAPAELAPAALPCHVGANIHRRKEPPCLCGGFRRPRLRCGLLVAVLAVLCIGDIDDDGFE